MGVQNPEAATSPDASTDETLDDVSIAAPAPADVVDGNTAEPSPAAKDEGASSFLDVVRDAVDKSAPDSSPETKQRDHQAAAPTKEPDNENFSDVPFHKHPRFQELVGQRNALKEPAARFNELVEFMNKNAMTGEEVTNAINWFALRKQDPATAWAEIKPFIQELLLEIGEIIPPDIRAQVQSGQLTADVAKVLAKERAKATLAQGQMSFRDQQTARQKDLETRQAAENQRTALKLAARDWAATQEKDPDFSKKQDALTKEVLFLQRQEGVPNTPEGVKAQLTKAMKAVNTAIQATRPRRPGIRPVTGGSTGGNVQSAPESFLDVVRAGRAAH